LFLSQTETRTQIANSGYLPSSKGDQKTEGPPIAFRNTGSGRRERTRQRGVSLPNSLQIDLSVPRWECSLVGVSLGLRHFSLWGGAVGTGHIAAPLVFPIYQTDEGSLSGVRVRKRPDRS
jgi:hypothetical protein